MKLLSEVGPDIPEISRRLGQFKESVRYRYKEKIVNRGFAVQATVDHEKLGLQRIMLVVEMSDSYKEYAQSIFAAMHELCFLVGFEKTLVRGEYIVSLSVPKANVDEIKAFFENLKEKGMFTRLDVLEFEWVRVAPMKAEYYDFDTGRWDFDWQNRPPQDFQSASAVTSGPAKFDFVDLLILKELQMDANKSLKEISDKLGINYKKLAWHHTTHVVDRKIIPSYSVNWMGTRYDYTLEKALHRKHRYFAVELYVRNVTEYELMALRHDIEWIPFLWGEAGGRNYFAQFAIPVDNVVEGLQYLGNIAASVKDRMNLYPIDQSEALTFSIPYKSFDPVAKRWAFNSRELTEKFESLIVQIKAGIS